MMTKLPALLALLVSLPFGKGFQSVQTIPYINVGRAPQTSILFSVSEGSMNTDSMKSAAESSKKNNEEWTKPRLHNSFQFRAAAVLTVLAAVGAKAPSEFLATRSTGTLHLLSFASWFGMVFYTTFIAGITMFKNLPRQTFGKLQAKLFPKYFALSSVFLVLQLVTLKGLAIEKSISVKALGVALVMTLLNQFYLEPTSTSNMMERYELEDKKETDTDRYKKLKSNFGKFHGMSSLTNLIAFCGGVAHAAFLATSLVKP